MQYDDLSTDFDHAITMLTGFESLFYGSTPSIDGCEHYVKAVISLYKASGMEAESKPNSTEVTDTSKVDTKETKTNTGDKSKSSKVWDGIKKAAEAVYESIKNALNKIKEYFFGGDGEKDYDDNLAKAKDSLERLKKLNRAPGMDEKYPGRKRSKFISDLPENSDFEAFFTDNPQLKSKYDALSKAVDELVEQSNYGLYADKLSAVYSKAEDLGDSSKPLLEKKVKETENDVEKIKNPRTPKGEESGNKEVESTIKSENKEVTEKAKVSLSHSKCAAKLLTKATVCLSSIHEIAKDMIDHPPKSEFKG